jgi:hypothetical protein
LYEVQGKSGDQESAEDNYEKQETGYNGHMSQVWDEGI